jgi:hypothetical protein
MKRKVAVLGASEDTSAYSHKAVQLLLNKGYDVIAIGKNPGKIGSLPIHTPEFIKSCSDVDTVTLYLNPCNQIPYYEWITNIKPQKVVFNPGAENPELQKILDKHQIPYVNACSLVLLNLNQF